MRKWSSRKGTATCYLRSDCRRDEDNRFFKEMFERDWATFVIKPDPITGEYRGTTICCETTVTKGVYDVKPATAACC